MSLPPFEYLAPRSTEELAELLATRGAGLGFWPAARI